jgi:hypothetical protein
MPRTPGPATGLPPCFRADGRGPSARRSSPRVTALLSPRVSRCAPLWIFPGGLRLHPRGLNRSATACASHSPRASRLRSGTHWSGLSSCPFQSFLGLVRYCGRNLARHRKNRALILVVANSVESTRAQQPCSSLRVPINPGFRHYRSSTTASTPHTEIERENKGGHRHGQFLCRSPILPLSVVRELRLDTWVVSTALPCGFGNRGAVNSSSVSDFAMVPLCCVGKATAAPIRGKDSTITFARAHTSFCILHCAFGRLVARIDRFRPCRRRTLALRRRSQPAGGRKAPVRWISDARVTLKPKIPLRQFKSEPSDFNRVARGRLDRGHSWTVGSRSWGRCCVPIRNPAHLILRSQTESGGADCPVPLRFTHFAKEAPGFQKTNPPSHALLAVSGEFCVVAPVLSGFYARSPGIKENRKRRFRNWFSV